MQVAVESWSPEYGAPADDGALAASSGDVDLDVELPAAGWRPLTPPADVSVPAVLGFVDGVRRVDARVWVTGADGQPRQGICATWAAGVVRCDASAKVSSIAAIEVRRGLFTPVRDATVLSTRFADYPVVAVPDDEPDQLSLALQGSMAELEHRVSDRAASADGPADLLVVDGPLRQRQRLVGAVGYVKTHHAAYLPETVRPVVAALSCGQRTPVFEIGGRFSRWSWYLRLPCTIDHGWSGIVRCEASPELPVAAAVERADQVAATLPRFASAPQKDPRAPQNLYPIAGLERALSRRLGDPLLLFRSLREAAFLAA
jgi:hypothetical protein